MNILLGIGISILTFIFMEGVAWFTHKFIMHGFMWSWHKSHHVHHNDALERNDLFALVFSLPAMACIILGFELPSEMLKYIGFGITAYGIMYFIFHDIIVHQRIRIRIPKKFRYLEEIIEAHYIHHRTHTKEGASHFGFLYTADKSFSKKNTNNRATN